MICLVQRVKNASVSVDGEIISQIGAGLLVLAAVFADDVEADIMYCAKKCVELRIFADANDLMNLSVQDIEGEILAVSQFTLCASVRKGRRPSFDRAMKPVQAEEMFDRFVQTVASLGVPVKNGVFGASMAVELINDGPVTIIVDSREAR